MKKTKIHPLLDENDSDLVIDDELKQASLKAPTERRRLMTEYVNNSRDSFAGRASKKTVASMKKHRGTSFTYRRGSTTNFNTTDRFGYMMVTTINSVFRKLKIYAGLSFFLAIFGIILDVFGRELQYYFIEKYDKGTSMYLVVNSLRGISSLISLLLVWSVFEYYKTEFVFFQLNRVYLMGTSWRFNRIACFLLEACVCLIHSPPFIDNDVEMHLDDLGHLLPPYSAIVRNPWSLLIFCRLYLILRFIKHRYYTPGARILGMWHNFEFSTTFTVRNLLHSHPLKTLMPLMAILVLTTSYGLLVCERPIRGRVFDTGSALWLIFITMLGVGYGDLIPRTQCGRGVTVVLILGAHVYTAVLVAAVAQMLTLYPYELRMVEFLERSENDAALRRKAARLIGRVWRAQRSKILRQSGHPPQLPAAEEKSSFARARGQHLKIQAFFDFQASLTKAQTYDRRFAANQLFRSILERVSERLDDTFLSFATAHGARAGSGPPRQGGVSIGHRDLRDSICQIDPSMVSQPFAEPFSSQPQKDESNHSESLDEEPKARPLISPVKLRPKKTEPRSTNTNTNRARTGSRHTVKVQVLTEDDNMKVLQMIMERLSGLEDKVHRKLKDSS